MNIVNDLIPVHYDTVDKETQLFCDPLTHNTSVITVSSDELSNIKTGMPGWLSGLKPLPSAQVMSPGSLD